MTHEIEAKLAEIRAGLEGVTSGPWQIATDLPAIAIMALTADGKGGYRVVQTPNQNNYRHFGPANPWDGIQHWSDANHIARLDPQTVASILSYIDDLKRERDEYRDRAEELEGYREQISAEFEKDCWKALRSLLNECNFPWQDFSDEGVTADQAREHIAETLNEIEAQQKRDAARADALATENATLKELAVEAEDVALDAEAAVDYFVDDLRLEDDDGECTAELLCGDPACHAVGCLILKRARARALLTRLREVSDAK